MRWWCRLSVVFSFVVALAGCATPGQMGSGSGAQYTPLVDLAGEGAAQFQADLSECRRVGEQVSLAESAGSEALMQGALGFAMAAALRLPPSAIGNVVDATASRGVYSGLREAEVRQRQAVVRCLAMRGYRVLEAGAPAPSFRPVRAPVSALAAQAQAAPQVRADGRLVPVTAPPPRDVIQGQDSYAAEQIGRAASCPVRASLSGKGPAWEVYTLACPGGHSLVVRCEWGACRELR